MSSNFQFSYQQPECIIYSDPQCSPNDITDGDNYNYILTIIVISIFVLFTFSNLLFYNTCGKINPNHNIGTVAKICIHLTFLRKIHCMPLHIL